MGATQLLSVPYALYSENPGNPGPQGPPGIDGIDGAPGAPGPPGVLTVKAFSGSIGTIPITSPGFGFVGPTTSVTLISGYTRMTGSASASISMPPGGPYALTASLCYQQGAGLITSFANSGNIVAQINDQLTPVAVSTSVVLSPGTYTVGFCVANGNTFPVTNTLAVSGWVVG